MNAFLFPGQGAQFVGMGRDLYENFPIAKNIYDRADTVLGFKISSLCFDGPLQELTLTKNSQPAILVTSIAVLEVLKSHCSQLSPSFVAGLSLGEYSALVAAEVIGFEDAVYLIRKRGEFMQEAAEENPGTMLSIIGLEREVVLGVCKQADCEVANFNCPGQIVVTGTSAAIAKAEGLAKEQNALRTVPLQVSGAFHSSLMKSAEEKLAKEIGRVTFGTAKIPVVSNVTYQSETDPQVIKNNLIRQVSSSTYWEDSIRFMIAQGVASFYEVGPGTVLRGLNRKIDPSVKTTSICTKEQIGSLSC